MAKKEVKIGLLGFGTVGSGVYDLLTRNHALLEERTGISFKVEKIFVRDPAKKRAVSFPKELLTTKVEDVLSNSSIDIVVEVMGGVDPTAYYLLQAIAAGKQVVTANKALLADRGGEIFRAAREKGLSVGYEASVAGGIPILKAIREGFVGNRIQEIYGIINGTSNFILTEMSQKGLNFKDVLKQAQEAGYAEQDPSLDVNGKDAAQKLAILISLCYGVEPSQKGIFVEGIEQVTPQDIEFARKLGYAVKLLGIAKEHADGIEARVHPTLIPLHHPLAEVGGVFNAIFLKGDAVGQTMFMGKGAGMLPTASAVVSDIAMAATGIAEKLAILPLREASIQPMAELSSEYYLRFSVVDKPGVLARIANHLGEGEISISNVYQQDRDAGSKVPIIVMTHEAKEKNIQKAIAEIDKMDVVLDKTMLMRVQRFPK
jgi:homoserine dehydrogenase